MSVLWDGPFLTKKDAESVTFSRGTAVNGIPISRPKHAEGANAWGHVEHGAPADPQDRGPEGPAGAHHQGAAAPSPTAPGASGRIWREEASVWHFVAATGVVDEPTWARSPEVSGL